MEPDTQTYDVPGLYENPCRDYSIKINLFLNSYFR